MEQQNQQPIQEKTESKPPVKTNWKYITIVILVTLFTGIGVLTYFVGQQTPTLSQDAVQRAPLVNVYTHGGLCATGECRSQIVINRDGTFVYIPDLNIKVWQDTQMKGSINPQKLSSLAQSIEQSNLTEIKKKKFTEICPTAYDGAETVYTFYAGNVVEEIASCTVAIDYTSSPFQILDEIINNEILSRTQGEDERDNAVDTSSWQTYRNDEFGFEVKYPKDFIDSLHGIDTILFTKKEVFDNPTATFYGQKPEPRELLIWSISIARKATLDTFCKDWVDSGYTKKNILLNGFSAARCTNINLYRSNTFVAIPKDNDLIIFTLYYDQYEYLSVYDQILSTFRFVEGDKLNTNKTVCEAAGGTYVGCPANPDPNMGLCLPCECPRGLTWSLTERSCVGICPGEHCNLDKTIPY